MTNNKHSENLQNIINLFHAYTGKDNKLHNRDKLKEALMSPYMKQQIKESYIFGDESFNADDIIKYYEEQMLPAILNK